MKQIRAVIIDDEVNNSNYLKGLLESHLPHVHLAGTAASVNEGIELITREQPDLVFLDIELHTSTGFDLLSRIDPIKFSVIFTTAHERYALKAIKFAALDFLLKPIDAEELVAAVGKAVKQQSENSFGKGIEVFLENLKRNDDHKKIAVYTTNGIIVLELKNMVYCQADGPYTNIHTTTGKVMSSKHLKEYETMLSDYHFFRVHKSYLVNLNHIVQFVRADGGSLVMSNGHKVDVSDKKKAELLNHLSKEVLFVK